MNERELLAAYGLAGTTADAARERDRPIGDEERLPRVHRGPVTLIQVERFWDHVERSSGCWLWRGSRNRSGYGLVTIAGQARLAHRLAFELARGPIPRRAVIRHLCVGTRHCVRPEHLAAGSVRENMADLARQRRSPRWRSGVTTRELEWRARRRQAVAAAIPAHIQSPPDGELSTVRQHAPCSIHRAPLHERR